MSRAVEFEMDGFRIRANITRSRSASWRGGLPQQAEPPEVEDLQVTYDFGDRQRDITDCLSASSRKLVVGSCLDYLERLERSERIGA